MKRDASKNDIKLRLRNFSPLLIGEFQSAFYIFLTRVRLYKTESAFLGNENIEITKNWP